MISQDRILKKTARILAVDDEPFNLSLISLTFKNHPDISIIKAYSGKEALQLLASDTNFDTILLDINMPVMDGLETLKVLKSDAILRRIPVIVVTANKEEKTKALKLGANDFLTKPFDTEELKLRTLNYIEIKRYSDVLENITHILEEQVSIRTRELSEALQHAKETEYEISLRLGKASEFRDMETGMHIVRTSVFSENLARLAGLTDKEAELIRYASPLHDIGKIGIPDQILLKPGKFSEAEMQIMKQHTIIGAKMLENADKFPVIKAGQIIAYEHHEKWDGTGYPRGLKGEHIHIYGRITAIADVFDAVTSRRVYRPVPFSLDKTLELFKSSAGKHFDPHLTELFLNNFDLFLSIKNQFPDEIGTPNILKLLEQIRPTSECLDINALS